ncbi:uncharacterized protein GGS22DRAFT_152726 [Annulohypoxylon maeteangense]|uniref:uncharacterized protein n=1 Tax=Annulohypoxylon maeteangense TaxID=1927788 RepID=UPI002007BEBF|nr:uncharacterized protein GGS22DRAFT_152726 [Annulohypoxylon maeteangense]KAI0888928.1 hypothetical protein GGS22DRAFT_152726 [Annulohypoxylon maeteangense]
MPPPEPLRALARLAAPASTSSSTPPPTTISSFTGKLHALASRTHLLPRLATDVSTVPEGYGRTPNGPAPGAVVGIVLGSIAGFILLLGLIYWCVNIGNATPPDIESGSVGAGGSSSVVSYRSRPRVHRHSNRHTHTNSRSDYSPRRRTKETIEITRRDVRREVSPPSSPGVDQIIVMEEHGRSGSSRSRSRSTSVSRVHARRMLDEDEIVVEEENSTPPRRRDSRRSYGRRRSSERRSGQFRYSGGEGSRDMSRRRRSSSRRA